MHLMKQLNDALQEEVKENKEKIANLHKKEQKFQIRISSRKYDTFALVITMPL